ncbi:DUF2407 C-terminal domain-containing protein [Abortiporus biennis]|nr:DUF2407 C-terminal domain-containing protein [Abortiporus biennis]
MLSEKAKGKQRATEPVEDEDIQAKTLIIRFTEGFPDLSLEVREGDTVRDVKQYIRQAREPLKQRRLRLIHSGRLLTDGTHVYPLIVAQEEKQKPSSSDASSSTPSSPTDPAPVLTTWLHCSVGPQTTDGEEEEASVQTAQLKPLRGFDRLAAAGFSEQDIANIRLQFHAHSSGDYLDHDFENDEDFDEYARNLEEQWIDSMDSIGSMSDPSSTSTPTMLQGILLGFFFPLLPFFFFHQSKPAVFWEDGNEHHAVGVSVFSRRMQMGIVAGLAMNFLFGVWTYFLASD